MAELYNISEFFGIAQHRDGAFLNTGTAADARNMDTSDGNLSVAKGYKRQTSNAIPTSGKILRLIPVDNSHILAVTQKNIYSGDYFTWNEAPVYTFGDTLPEDCQIGYTTAKINTDNIVVIGTGRTQMVKVIIGETVTAEVFGSEAGGSTAHCNYACTHYGRLFAAGDPEAPNRLYWSTIPGDGRTIEHWLQVEASADLSGGFVEVGDTTRDPIIGLAAISSQIVIFKRYSIFRLYGDRPSYYTVERVANFTDDMSNAGVSVMTDIPFWLSKSGIKYFDGNDMQLLDGGKNYIKTFLESVNRVSDSKAFNANGKLYFSCRVGDNTYDDSLIVFDSVNGTYMVRDGFKIADMCSFDNVIYHIGESGYLNVFDVGDSYDGDLINAYWETQPTDLSAKFLKKQLKEVFFRSTPGTILIDVTNGNVTTAERRVVFEDEEMIEIPLQADTCRRFRLRFSNENGGAFTIRGGIQILYEGSMRP